MTASRFTRWGASLVLAGISALPAFDSDVEDVDEAADATVIHVAEIGDQAAAQPPQAVESYRVLQPAAGHENAWIDWVGSTASDVGWWHGGDGNTSIQLPNGQVWHFFADTYDGLVDADFSRGSVGSHLVHNSIVVRDADGSFVGQVWDDGGGPPGRGPAIRPDPDEYPDLFYWPPAGAVIEDGNLRIFAALVQPDIQRADTHILTLDTDTGAVLDVTPTASQSTLKVSIIGVVEYAGWYYIHGPRVTDKPYGDGWAMLRAPVGSLRNVSSWQAWDGQRWNEDATSHAPLLTTDGDPIPTLGIDDNAFRLSDNGFLGIHKPLDSRMTLFRSDRPEGPYEVIGTVSTSTREGAEHHGGYMGSYAPRWHPHYDTDEGLVVSYATNYFSKPDLPDTERDNLYYMPNYAIVPVDVVASGP